MNIPHGKLRPSRTVALALLGVLAGATYFLVVVGVTALLHAQEGMALALALMIVPFVSAVVAAIVLPAERTRAWLRVAALLSNSPIVGVARRFQATAPRVQARRP